MLNYRKILTCVLIFIYITTTSIQGFASPAIPQSEIRKTEKIPQSKLDDSDPAHSTQDTILTNMPSGLNPILYRYGSKGNNESITDSLGNNILFNYDNKGRLKKSQISDSNGKLLFATTYSYNASSPHIKQLKTEDATGKVLVDYDYKYNKKGNCTIEEDNTTGNHREFIYDGTNELVEERYYNSASIQVQSITYAYDKSGNMIRKTSVIQNNTVVTNYTYNNQNQITSINGKQVYSYDENGNVAYDGKNQNNYNKNNQLVEVKQDNKVVESYNYNNDGLRSTKISNSETTVYNYNGTDVSWTGDKDNRLKYFFTRDTDGRLLNLIDYTSPNPATYWYLFDGFGNVIGLVDKNSTKVVGYQYDALGSLVDITGNIKTGAGKLLADENPFRYSGYAYDKATGYYYLNSRFYDPSIGRFTSLDSFKDHAKDPVNQNLYLYCANNPIRYYDPSGNVYIQLYSTGNDVVTLQSKLEMMGYFSLPANTDYGYFGQTTKDAVIRFQTSKKLWVDGVVGAGSDAGSTWRELGLKPYDFILARGSTGEKVTALQQELEKHGCIIIPTNSYGNKVYGSFKSLTEEAVNFYKDDHGLSNDGVFKGKVGGTTWDNLFGSSQWASQVIGCKRNLEKLGYNNLKNYLGLIDDTWYPQYNDDLWDFIDKYGKTQEYTDSGCNKTLLFSWIQAAVDGNLGKPIVAPVPAGPRVQTIKVSKTSDGATITFIALSNGKKVVNYKTSKSDISFDADSVKNAVTTPLSIGFGTEAEAASFALGELDNAIRSGTLTGIQKGNYEYYGLAYMHMQNMLSDYNKAQKYSAMMDCLISVGFVAFAAFETVVLNAEIESVAVGENIIADEEAIQGAADVEAEAIAEEEVQSGTGGIGPVLKGREGVQKSADRILSEGGDVIGNEVYIKSKNGTVVSVDLVYRDKNNIVRFCESKNGPYARYTKNQKIGYPDIEQNGGTVFGTTAKKSGISKNIGPTKIEVDWWGR